jgi:nucleoside-diphosphate-sugar epimerase
MPSSVLLTGATGFIGSHVARLLVREGVEVHALVRTGSDLRRVADLVADLRLARADLLDAAEVERHVIRIAPEVCIHAAWHAQPGSYLQADENTALVAASAALATQLGRAGCRRFVGLGTCLEYDVSTGTLAESTLTRPASLYAASKLATFLLMEQVGALTGMEVAWARLFYQYGPSEDHRRLVPATIRALQSGEEAPVTKGEQVRDFLHVEDVAAAIWSIARSGVVGAVNVGSGEAITVRGLVEIIGAIVGRPELLAFGAIPDRRGDPPYVCADNRRLVKECGWRRSRNHEDGLRETVEWWARADAVGLHAAAVTGTP